MLKYEITKDTNMDFRYMRTDKALISKQALKDKNLPWHLKTGKIKKEVSNN